MWTHMAAKVTFGFVYVQTKSGYQSEATQLGFGLVAYETFCVTP